MKRRTFIITSLIAFASTATWLSAGDVTDYPETRSLSGWQSFDPDDYADGWLVLDRNEDGIVDYAVQVDEHGEKTREAMDFNYDGAMDDFYFYRNGVLERQEIDTNYDQQIDAWVHLRRGVYIEMWERDRDHDGVIDDRGVYGSDNQ